jgi:hypothetical protein
MRERLFHADDVPDDAGGASELYGRQAAMPRMYDERRQAAVLEPRYRLSAVAPHLRSQKRPDAGERRQGSG